MKLAIYAALVTSVGAFMAPAPRLVNISISGGGGGGGGGQIIHYVALLKRICGPLTLETASYYQYFNV